MKLERTNYKKAEKLWDYEKIKWKKTINVKKDEKIKSL